MQKGFEGAERGLDVLSGSGNVVEGLEGFGVLGMGWLGS